MRELVDQLVACVDECVSLAPSRRRASRDGVTPRAVAATRCRGDGVTLDALPRRWRPRRPKKKTPLKTVEERRRPVLLGGVLGDDGRDALDGASQQHEAECYIILRAIIDQ